MTTRYVANRRTKQQFDVEELSAILLRAKVVELSTLTKNKYNVRLAPLFSVQ